MLPRRYQKLKQILDKRQPDLTVLTEDVHKTHNLSAILRTCDAVGVFELNTINQYSQFPTFNQVAKGSQKWVLIRTHPDVDSAIKCLQTQEINVYAAHLSETSIDFRQLDYTQPTAILLGAEKWGVSEKAANLVDRHIAIPMMGMVQSLNVSVAAAVILYEAQRQRLAAGYYDQIRLDPATYQKVLFEWAYPELAKIYQEKLQSYPALSNTGEIVYTS